MLWKQLFATKSLDRLLEEMKGDNRLRRVLGPISLTALGVGAIIGAGIFVMTGRAAAVDAGPAIMISYCVAGLGCLFAALCYAEFASLAPVAGSAYTYAYATLGELLAWIIGWDLILEYAMACACVAASWSKYFNAFLKGCHLPTVPDFLIHDPFSHPGAWFNLPALLIVLLVTAILVIGIRESARTNAVLVAVKTGVVLFVILVGIFFVSSANWFGIPPTERLTAAQQAISDVARKEVAEGGKLTAAQADQRIRQISDELVGLRTLSGDALKKQQARIEDQMRAFWWETAKLPEDEARQRTSQLMAQLMVMYKLQQQRQTEAGVDAQREAVKAALTQRVPEFAVSLFPEQAWSRLNDQQQAAVAALESAVLVDAVRIGTASLIKDGALTQDDAAGLLDEALAAYTGKLVRRGRLTEAEAAATTARLQAAYRADPLPVPQELQLANRLLTDLEKEGKKKSAEKWGILAYLGLNETLTGIDDSFRSPFLPYGLSGIMLGAAIVFFAFIGFDSISTHSEEAIRPQRDVPIGILASLAICTVLYIGVSAVITGMVPYHTIDQNAAISTAFLDKSEQLQDNFLLRAAGVLIATGALAGMTSVLLITFLSQARIFLAMARDKEMVNIGTLMAFVIVCGSVWMLRYTQPNAHRPFKTPLLWFVAPAGIFVNFAMMLFLPIDTWGRLVVWLLAGLCLYFSYGYWRSAVRRELQGGGAPSA
jgi:amino acid transporter